MLPGRGQPRGLKFRKGKWVYNKSADAGAWCRDWLHPHAPMTCRNTAQMTEPRVYARDKERGRGHRAEPVPRRCVCTKWTSKVFRKDSDADGRAMPCQPAMSWSLPARSSAVHCAQSTSTVSLIRVQGLGPVQATPARCRLTHPALPRTEGPRGQTAGRRCWCCPRHPHPQSWPRTRCGRAA